jgi:hypothetical protein
MKDQTFVLRIPAAQTFWNNKNLKVRIKVERDSDGNRKKVDFINVSTDTICSVINWNCIWELAVRKADELFIK